MQSVQLCVRVIFCFRHAQQIVRGHAIELRQRDNTERADVFEIVCLIFAEGGLGKPGLLRKLFQRQAPFHSQILQSLLYGEFYLHGAPLLLSVSKRGNLPCFALFSDLLDIRERAHFFVKLYL